VNTAGKNQVAIGVKDDRDIADLPQALDEPEDFPLVDARGQGPLGSQLIGKAISQGIRKRHPQFEQVDPALDQLPTNRKGRLLIGITRANVGNEQSPAGFTTRGKSLLDSIHKGGSMMKTQNLAVGRGD